ncbi:hypothetical protein QWZ13_05455 [Reinekea marina]|uniref:hypothetical protein n=1 Tax=Reinekea marina TaxID=1310421 RepID=UPI0025B33500|nr:hypothetical protein [Reinekea marina]MDN3648351.1 hypothetical protein [Reinekea marina]
MECGPCTLTAAFQFSPIRTKSRRIIHHLTLLTNYLHGLCINFFRDQSFWL